LKVLVDEILPKALAYALAALFVGDHEVVHLRDKFGPKVKDIEWIPALSAEAGWVIISLDRRITRNKAELQAFKNSRLIGFFFPRSLEKSKLTKKVERLMALWETIEKQVPLAAGGSMFELPAKSNKFRTL
jgi:hypothetical protein